MSATSNVEPRHLIKATDGPDGGDPRIRHERRSEMSPTKAALARQRWLFVEDSPFLPPRSGGQREHLGMLRAARQAGVLGAVVLPVDQPISEAEYERELGVPVVVVPRRLSPLLLMHPRRPYVVASRPPQPGLAERVAQSAAGLTGIVVTTYKSWDIGRALARDLRLPTILRQHNRESLYHRSLAEETPGVRGWVYRWESWRIARDEKRLSVAPWLRGTADISVADAQWRRAQGARNVMHVAPFALDPRAVPQVSRPASGSPRILFLGALDVPTNHAALRWLLNGVWPIVRRESPDATLMVVGARPSQALRRDVAATTGAELHADVPEIRPYLESAHVAVNPAVTGSGVNIKIVEYMTAGVPVVATSFCTQGLPLRPGLDLQIHDQPAEFADAVLRLLTEPDHAARMAATGRERLLEILDPDANLERLATLLQGEIIAHDLALDT